jgi:hypothetical protein
MERTQPSKKVANFTKCATVAHLVLFCIFRYVVTAVMILYGRMSGKRAANSWQSRLWMLATSCNLQPYAPARLNDSQALGIVKRETWPNSRSFLLREALVT